MKLTTDPEGRAAGGHSSGGIAAFTMGWHRPDQFRRILTHSGSFVSIRGGDKYPGIVTMAMPVKPLRVFLSVGTKDNEAPRWQRGNEGMAGALKQQGYHYRFVLQKRGTHAQTYPASILPETLLWLWRGYPDRRQVTVRRQRDPRYQCEVACLPMQQQPMELVKPRLGGGAGDEGDGHGGQAGQRRRGRAADPQHHRDRGERQPVATRDAARRAGRAGEVVPDAEPRGEHPAGDVADGQERDEHAAAATGRDRGGGGRRAQQADGQQRQGQRVRVLGPQDGAAARADGGRRGGDRREHQRRHDGRRPAQRQPDDRRGLPLLGAIDRQSGETR